MSLTPLGDGASDVNAISGELLITIRALTPLHLQYEAKPDSTFAGVGASNVIPNSAELLCTIRALVPT